MFAKKTEKPTTKDPLIVAVESDNLADVEAALAQMDHWADASRINLAIKAALAAKSTKVLLPLVNHPKCLLSTATPGLVSKHELIWLAANKKNDQAVTILYSWYLTRDQEDDLLQDESLKQLVNISVLAIAKAECSKREGTSTGIETSADSLRHYFLKYMIRETKSPHLVLRIIKDSFADEDLKSGTNPQGYFSMSALPEKVAVINGLLKNTIIQGLSESVVMLLLNVIKEILKGELGHQDEAVKFFVEKLYTDTLENIALVNGTLQEPELSATSDADEAEQTDHGRSATHSDGERTRGPGDRR